MVCLGFKPGADEDEDKSTELLAAPQIYPIIPVWVCSFHFSLFRPFLVTSFYLFVVIFLTRNAWNVTRPTKFEFDTHPPILKKSSLNTFFDEPEETHIDRCMYRWLN